jgi:Nif-specific regulatory protein
VIRRRADDSLEQNTLKCPWVFLHKGRSCASGRIGRPYSIYAIQFYAKMIRAFGNFVETTPPSSSNPVSVTRDERLSQFYPLILELHSMTNSNAVLQRILQFCLQALDAPYGLIALIEYEKEFLDIRVKTERDLMRKTTKLALMEPIFKKIAFEAHYEVVSDYSDSSFYLPFYRGSRSAVYVPLTLLQTAISVQKPAVGTDKKNNSNVVAMLVVESNKPRAFTNEDLAFLLALCSQSAALIKTIQRFEALQKENQLRDELTSKILSMDPLQSHQLDLLLKNILELAFELTGTAHGEIMLLEEDTGDLIIKQQAIKGDFLEKPPTRMHYVPGQRSGISFEVLKTRVPYVCTDISKDAHYVQFFRNIQSNLGIPIIFQGRAIGVLMLESTRLDAFSLQHVKSLQKLVDEMVFFLRRAQLGEYIRSRGGEITIIGKSKIMQEVDQFVEKVSQSDSTVLLLGESGVGKELIAHAIHFNSKRRDKPFITVNCGGLTEEILANELFGHVKGSFTGAIRDQMGKFELAHQGTLFLDEVADMSIKLQTLLLRAVQYGEIQKIGEDKPNRKVNVRIICATNQDMLRLVAEGKFRKDLYYRVNVVPLYIPPLRERKEDVPVLVNYFLEKFSVRNELPVKRISPEAIKVLQEYDWPGNVRELENIVERLVILTGDALIQPRHLPGMAGVSAPSAPSGNETSLQEKVATVESQLIRQSLVENAWNVSTTARKLGLTRQGLQKKIRKYALRKGQADATLN